MHLVPHGAHEQTPVAPETAPPRTPSSPTPDKESSPNHLPVYVFRRCWMPQTNISILLLHHHPPLLCHSLPAFPGAISSEEHRQEILLHTMYERPTMSVSRCLPWREPGFDHPNVPYNASKLAIPVPTSAPWARMQTSAHFFLGSFPWRAKLVAIGKAGDYGRSGSWPALSAGGGDHVCRNRRVEDGRCHPGTTVG